MVSSPWNQLVVPPGTLLLILAQPCGTSVVVSSNPSVSGPQMGVGVGVSVGVGVGVGVAVGVGVWVGVGVGVPLGGVGVGPPFWRITPMLGLKFWPGEKSNQVVTGLGLP